MVVEGGDSGGWWGMEGDGAVTNSSSYDHSW